MAAAGEQLVRLRGLPYLLANLITQPPYHISVQISAPSAGPCARAIFGITSNLYVFIQFTLKPVLLVGRRASLNTCYKKPTNKINISPQQEVL